MAEMAEAETACPHSSSVIALTLRVETPWTYISARVAAAPAQALVALEQLGGEAAVAVCGTRSSSLPTRSDEGSRA